MNKTFDDYNERSFHYKRSGTFDKSDLRHFNSSVLLFGGRHERVVRFIAQHRTQYNRSHQFSSIYRRSYWFEEFFSVEHVQSMNSKSSASRILHNSFTSKCAAMTVRDKFVH